MISSSRHAGLTVIQVISKYFVERAHYVVKVRGLDGWMVVCMYVYVRGEPGER